MAMFSEIVHIKWPYLVKLAILIWLNNLLAMPIKLPIYLPITYLPIYLNMSYLPTYLLIVYLPTYLLTHIPSTYLCLT